MSVDLIRRLFEILLGVMDILIGVVNISDSDVFVYIISP